MIKYLLPLAFLSFSCYSQQNLKENYSPLKSTGSLPDVFTQNIRNVIETDIKELNKKQESDNFLKRTYLT